MSESKDALLRYLALLQLIPRLPGRISTPALLGKLHDRGFFIDIRSLQRDLKDKLSLLLPIVCHDQERPFRWSIDSQVTLNLPALDTPAALTLYLAEGHLKNLLPPGVMTQLGPQFRAARDSLNGMTQNGLANWSRRVRALPNGKVLLPAEVDPQVWADVSASLVENKQLKVTYLSRSKGENKVLRVHPAGLVSRHSVSYLIGTVNEYDDLRQFALHRIKQCVLLEVEGREHGDFDIDGYIASGAFSSRLAEYEVELVADVHPQIAWLLNETPLSSQQTLEPLKDTDWQRLCAQVPLDQETLWWIFGLNDNIRVYEPQVWVDEIRAKYERLRALYDDATSTVAAVKHDRITTHSLG